MKRLKDRKTEGLKVYLGRVAQAGMGRALGLRRYRVGGWGLRWAFHLFHLFHPLGRQGATRPRPYKEYTGTEAFPLFHLFAVGALRLRHPFHLRHGYGGHGRRTGQPLSIAGTFTWAGWLRLGWDGPLAIRGAESADGELRRAFHLFHLFHSLARQGAARRRRTKECRDGGVSAVSLILAIKSRTLNSP